MLAVVAPELAWLEHDPHTALVRKDCINGFVGAEHNLRATMSRVIGKEKCPIVDTWWQTETGGHMITPLPGAHTLKPGSASRPFFGVEPVVSTPMPTIFAGSKSGRASRIATTSAPSAALTTLR